MRITFHAPDAENINTHRFINTQVQRRGGGNGDGEGFMYCYSSRHLGIVDSSGWGNGARHGNADDGNGSGYGMRRASIPRAACAQAEVVNADGEGVVIYALVVCV